MSKSVYPGRCFVLGNHFRDPTYKSYLLIMTLDPIHCIIMHAGIYVSMYSNKNTSLHISTNLKKTLKNSSKKEHVPQLFVLTTQVVQKVRKYAFRGQYPNRYDYKQSS